MLDINELYYPISFCKEAKWNIFLNLFWTCHWYYTISVAIDHFLKGRRVIARSQLPEGALGKVMFCYDLGIFLECCYYWKRVPSGHRLSSPQKYSDCGWLSSSSSLEPELCCKAPWWLLTSIGWYLTFVRHLVLLVVVTQSYFNTRMIKSHRYCKLRALSSWDKFFCFNIKMTCDFFFFPVT